MTYHTLFSWIAQKNLTGARLSPVILLGDHFHNLDWFWGAIFHSNWWGSLSLYVKFMKVTSKTLRWIGGREGGRGGGVSLKIEAFAKWTQPPAPCPLQVINNQPQIILLIASVSVLLHFEFTCSLHIWTWRIVSWAAAQALVWQP